MTELHERSRTISASRLHELLERHACTSLVDPFMGVPAHLNYLKRHGIRVHGGDLLEWLVRAGEGLIPNDFTILRDSEVAEIVEMLPGRIYAVDMFRGWEGIFFTEEQCSYLSVWQQNVRMLRSDGQTGLAILGLWYVLCYWLEKARNPDDMPDIMPSELAWSYIRQTEKWVAANHHYNTVRQRDALTTIADGSADALFLAPPRRNAFRNVDPRIWMWEAWWQGNPYVSVEHVYGDSLFGARAGDERGYERALDTVLEAGANYRVIILQAADKAAAFESHLRAVRKNVEIVAPNPHETYLIGTN